MKCDPQQDHAITTGSFLDDSHFFCCCDTPGAAVSGICQSWRRSLEFDVITGLVTNGKKAFFFVCKSFQYCGPNPDPHGRISPEDSLKCKNSFVLVGSVVTSLGSPDLSHRNLRIAAAIEKLHKIRFAPVRFSHRVKMAAAIFPAAIFGCEQILPTKGLYESLRSAIVDSLYPLERQNVVALLGHHCHTHPTCAPPASISSGYK